MKHTHHLFAALLGLVLLLPACRWLEVNPDQYILAEDALETPEDFKPCSCLATTCWPTSTTETFS